ncbi:MAG: tRNA (adenosine(37)-N6)-threonylcarbamoyltransferase complex ATPase subunit type 1 TsaE [Capsulimonas sp.]|uniref:tRNA (adenosine(37)-N6)-threonylcarbamoyltransferase complex ATPase subunit type 1 TsaE n=1 Tax=Capsulimonas sp. TaxID=2494211 RepID=UPI003267CC1E
MISFERLLSTEAETRAAAAALGPILFPGDVLCLIGGLGAGKTTFTQGLAQGLGLPEAAVHSPTFNIVFEHRDGRLPLFHFDVYRLSGPEALHDIAFDEYLEADGVTVIEWADKITDALPDDRMDLHLSSDGGNARSLTVEAHGARSEALAAQWREALT